MILAQHGFAAAERIEKGIKDGSIDGAVISASNVKFDDVQGKIQSIFDASKNADVYFDPEYYVNFMEEADKFGKLSSYPYFNHPKLITDLASPKVLQQVAKEVIDRQKAWGLRNIISPSIEITAFGSAQESYSLSLLNSSTEYVKDTMPDRNLFGTILVNENAFTDQARMAQFLDAITRIRDLQGFYVVIDRTGSTRPFWDNPQNLAAYMYLINTLVQNGKKVVLGYCDGTSILGLSVGATHASIGWWQNSTNFTKRRFIKSGGRRRKQYYSKQLMNSIYIDGELSVLVDRGFGAKVAGTTQYDSEIAADAHNYEWSDERSILHTWSAIKSTCDDVLSNASVNDRLARLEQLLIDARQVYTETNSQLPNGFDTATGPNKINVWLNAIKIYKDGVL